MGRSKDKGTRFESLVVKEIQKIPEFKVERMFSSTGRSRGLPEWVDIAIVCYHGFYLQCKDWKRFRKELFPDPALPALLAQIVKYPHGKPHAMLRLPEFLKLLRGHEMLYSIRRSLLERVEKESDPIRKGAFLEVYQQIDAIVYPHKPEEGEQVWSSPPSSKETSVSVSS